MIVEIPSLKLTSAPPRQSVWPSGGRVDYTSRHMIRGSNRLYELKGNTTIGRMDQDQLPHELRITILDAETDQMLWEHVEPVVIKRIADR